MAKVKVQWTIEVTETYEIELDFEDFAAMVDGEPPAIEDVKAGNVVKGDIDAGELAGSEDHATTLKYSSVDERYVDSFTVID